MHLVMAGFAQAADYTFEAYSPVRDLASHLEGKHGVRMLSETEPYSHLPLRTYPRSDGTTRTSPWPLKTRWSFSTDASTPTEIAGALLIAQRQWHASPSWDQCTTFEVVDVESWVEITPTRVVLGGRCQDHTSVLDLDVRSTDPSVFEDVMVDRRHLFGPTLRHDLRRQLRQGEGVSIVLARGVLGTQRLKGVGVGSGVSRFDPADYPFHPAHRAPPESSESKPEGLPADVVIEASERELVQP